MYEEDGEVRVRSKLFVPYTRPTHEPKRWYGGDYDDVVVRSPAGWRFTKRTCTARWLFTADGPDADSVPSTAEPGSGRTAYAGAVSSATDAGTSAGTTSTASGAASATGAARA